MTGDSELTNVGWALSSGIWSWLYVVVDKWPESEMTIQVMDVSSWFHGCRGSRGDKMSELPWTSDESSPWRVEEVELSNRQSGQDVWVVINESSIMDGSGCIVVIGYRVISGIWYKSGEHRA